MLTVRLNKTHQGIREEDIANAVNLLARRFGAPDYAMTNASQVRFLRMHMALTEPTFMGAGMAKPDAKIGDSINDTMSPAQALHLIDVLIMQKRLNPIYQIPVNEWDANKAEASFPRRPSDKHVTARDNPKAQEMHDVLSKSVSGLSVDGAGQLLDEALGTMGIH